MRSTRKPFGSTAIVAAAVLAGGCASPGLALDRSLLPGLRSLLTLPASAGIAWLEDMGLSEYHRTGVLNVAAANLGREPSSSRSATCRT